MSYNPTINTRTDLPVTGLSTLASATYAVSDAFTCNTTKPANVVVEVAAATTNTPVGNKQLVVFIKESIDGTNYRSGPETGTTTTDEPDLKFATVLPLNTASVTHRCTFDVESVLGYIPYSFKLVFKNDLGVALTSADVNTSTITY